MFCLSFGASGCRRHGDKSTSTVVKKSWLKTSKVSVSLGWNSPHREPCLVRFPASSSPWWGGSPPPCCERRWSASPVCRNRLRGGQKHGHRRCRVSNGPSVLQFPNKFSLKSHKEKKLGLTKRFKNNFLTLTFFAAPGVPDHNIAISGSGAEHSCWIEDKASSKQKKVLYKFSHSCHVSTYLILNTNKMYIRLFSHPSIQYELTMTNNRLLHQDAPSTLGFIVRNIPPAYLSPAAWTRRTWGCRGGPWSCLKAPLTSHPTTWPSDPRQQSPTDEKKKKISQRRFWFVSKKWKIWTEQNMNCINVD